MPFFFHVSGILVLFFKTKQPSKQNTKPQNREAWKKSDKVTTFILCAQRITATVLR